MIMPHITDDGVFVFPRSTVECFRARNTPAGAIANAREIENFDMLRKGLESFGKFKVVDD